MQQHHGWIDRALHGLLWLAAIVLVPLALVVSLGREWLPQLPSHKMAIEAWLSEQSKLVVRVGDIQADWSGFEPRLSLSNIQLFDPEHPEVQLLSLPKLSTELAIWESLRDANLRLQTQLEGISLHIVETDDGRFQVSEFADLRRTDPGSLEATLRWLFEQPTLRFEDSRVSLKRRGQPEHTFYDLALAQFLVAGKYRASASFRLAEAGDQQQVIFEIVDSPLAWRESPWTVYATVKDVRAWQGWAPMLPSGWRLRLEGGAVSAWLSGSQGRLKTSTFAVKKLSGDLRVGEQRFALAGLSTLATLEGDLSEGRLRFADASGQFAGRPLPLHSGLLSWSAKHLELYAAGMHVEALSFLADQYAPMSPALRQTIAEMKPSGIVPRIRISASRGEQGLAFGGISAELKAVSWQPRGKVPGAQHLAGWVQATAQAGLLYLDSRDTTILLPDVFHEPIQANTLRGGLRWFKANEAWYVQSNALQLDAPEAKTRTELALEIPDNGPAQLELLASLRDGEVASAWKFVPWHNTSANTLDWLQKSLAAGVVDEGVFAYSGKLEHGHPQEAQFQMNLGLKNATLDYLAPWPVLTELDGHVAIDGRDLRVHIARGRVMGGELKQVAARIPDLSHSVLAVDAQIGLDLQDLDTLLATAPIRKTTAAIAERLSMQGPADAQLALQVPLAGGHIGVQVEATLADATLGLASNPLSFDGVSGALAFDVDSGLSGSLTGNLWGEPASLMLKPELAANRWHRQHVEVDALVTSTGLAQWSGADLSNLLSGQTQVSVDVDLAVASRQPSVLSIKSDLAGMALTLPAPLSKAADEVLPFAYRGGLGDGAHKARATLGKRAQAGLLWRNGNLSSLALRVGLPGTAWQDTAGMTIDAAVNELDTAPWVSWLRRSSGEKSAVASHAPRLTRANVSAKRVLAEDLTLLGGQYSLQRDGKAWQVALNDVSVGEWPKWPATDAQARLISEDKQWRLDSLVVSQPAMQFSGQFTAAKRSALSGQLTAPRLELLLAQLGIEAPVTAKQVELTVDLKWPGGPKDFALANLSGTVAANLGAGRLKEVGEFPSVAKVFGLVNASNLLRRIRFDFTDLTRKGLSFDDIDFEGVIDRGVIEPAVIQLDGPSVNLRSKGRIDLVSKTVSQELKVDVPVSSAVPIVAGVLAGPVVGGALVAADLLLDKQLAKLTSTTVYLNGPWQDLRISEKPLTATEAQP